MIKKIAISTTVLAIILGTGTYIGKSVIEKEVTEELRTNTKINKILTDFSSFQCNILPFSCYIEDMKINIPENKYNIKNIFIKKSSTDGLTIYNIIKFLNNEEKGLFEESNKYKFKLNIEDLKINSKNLSILNINNTKKINLEITENLKSLGDSKAEDNVEFLLKTNDNKELILIKTDSNITVKEKNKMNISLNSIKIISDQNKMISNLYMNTMYSAYTKANEDIIKIKKDLGIEKTTKTLTKEEAIKYIKDNTDGQIFLIQKLLNNYSLKIDNNNSNKLKNILIGVDSEEFEIEIKGK